MSVLSMLSPLFPNDDRISSSQLAESSFVKIYADSQTVSGFTNFVPLTVGTTVEVRSRSFRDFVDFWCSLTLWQFRVLHEGTGHTSSLERVPPDVTVE